MAQNDRKVNRMVAVAVKEGEYGTSTESACFQATGRTKWNVTAAIAASMSILSHRNATWPILAEGGGAGGWVRHPRAVKSCGVLTMDIAWEGYSRGIGGVNLTTRTIRWVIAACLPARTRAGRRPRKSTGISAARLNSSGRRPLGELDLRVVCIDGKVFRDHCMVVALGIDTQGCKHVLGLREGATETAVVASGLLSDLVTRGLPTDPTLLFVIDGAPGLRRAITDVFGSLGVVQRCQVHKLRNVLGHLPERLHASVGKALRDA